VLSRLYLQLPTTLMAEVAHMRVHMSMWVRTREGGKLKRALGAYSADEVAAVEHLISTYTVPVGESLVVSDLAVDYPPAGALRFHGALCSAGSDDSMLVALCEIPAVFSIAEQMLTMLLSTILGQHLRLSPGIEPGDD
jgi:hypothetical protein